MNKLMTQSELIDEFLKLGELDNSTRIEIGRLASAALTHRLLSVAEIADIVRLSAGTVYRLIAVAEFLDAMPEDASEDAHALGSTKLMLLASCSKPPKALIPYLSLYREYTVEQVAAHLRGSWSPSINTSFELTASEKELLYEALQKAGATPANRRGGLANKGPALMQIVGLYMEVTADDQAEEADAA